MPTIAPLVLITFNLTWSEIGTAYTFAISTYGWTVTSMFPAIAPEGVASCYTIAADYFSELFFHPHLLRIYIQRISFPLIYLVIHPQPSVRHTRPQNSLAWGCISRWMDGKAIPWTGGMEGEGWKTPSKTNSPNGSTWLPYRSDPLQKWNRMQNPQVQLQEAWHRLFIYIWRLQWVYAVPIPLHLR